MSTTPEFNLRFQHQVYDIAYMSARGGGGDPGGGRGDRDQLVPPDRDLHRGDWRPGGHGDQRGGGRGDHRQQDLLQDSAANRLIGEVVQSWKRKRPLLGPTPG